MFCLFWDGLFSGAMSVLGSVNPPKGKEKIVFQSHHFFRGELSIFEGVCFFLFSIFWDQGDRS